MKKILLLSLATLMLTACQPTPEQNIIVEKDTERMVEQATASEATYTSDMQIEDIYSYEATGVNGKLTVVADAPVSVPTVQTLPIVEAHMEVFTQEMVYDVFNFLFGDEPAVDRSKNVETKAEIQEMIVGLKLTLDDTQGEYKEEIEQQIARLEQEYKTAPENENYVISDGTMGHMGGVEMDYGSIGLNVTDEEQTKFLHISTSRVAEDIEFNSYPMLTYSHENIYDSRALTPYEELTSAQLQSMSFSQEDALEICGDFLKVAGFSEDEYYLHDTYVMEDNDKNTDDGYAYKMIFGRNAGAPIFANSAHVGKSSEEFTFAWEYEIIELIVDKNTGIVEIYWVAPVKIGETVATGTTLKPYDEIKTTAANMLQLTYEGVVTGEFDEGWTVDVDISDVELALLRIRIPGENYSGIFVPAWIYYGSVYAQDGGINSGYLPGSYAFSTSTANADIAIESSLVPENETFEYNGFISENEEKNVVLIAINAIDGSIIDITKGY